MRLSTDRRRGVALLALALFAVTGCKDRPAAGPAAGSSTAGDLRDATGRGRAPRQAAEDFLKDLAAGKVTPTRLTPAFRSRLAPPTADADRAVEAFLTRFENATYVIAEEQTIGPAVVVRGRADMRDGKRQFSVRLIQAGDAFNADWLHLSERMGTGLQPPAEPDLKAAQDHLRNFLDVMMGGDHRLAHALMAPDLKKAVSPLPAGTKPPEGRDYDPGFLTQTTRAWIRDVVGYGISKPELAADKNAATFLVELEAGGQKTPVHVRMVKDPASGWWLVTAFDKQS